jgi:hypothetical protein
VARLSNVIDRILLCATVCRGVESMIAEPDPPPAELLRDRIETCARAMSACIAACSDGQRLGPACISCRHACERGLAACHTLLAVIDGETPESQLPVAAMAAG